MKCIKSECVAQARECHKLLMMAIRAGIGERSYRVKRDSLMRRAKNAKRMMVEAAATAPVTIRPTAIRCECGSHDLVRFVGVGTILHLVEIKEVLP